MRFWAFFALLLLAACQQDQPIPDEETPWDGIYRIPIVVHVLHLGEPLGEGHNLSRARIESQIQVLNQDFRRQAGTPGFNDHPDGADARIEFVLAKTAPDGTSTEGIVRVDMTQVENPVPSGAHFDYFAFYSYWDPALYLNIWSIPLPGLEDVFLGQATGPDTDLPGGDLFIAGEPTRAEGVHINSAHFGISNASQLHGMGRTATHEVGHYLGLLHLWGDGNCETNDFCEDTPPVSKHTQGCSGPAPKACDGQLAMVENYMDFTPDACMHVFTNDQIARMHYVLENSPFRKSLLTSPGLN